MEEKCDFCGNTNIETESISGTDLKGHQEVTVYKCVLCGNTWSD